MENYWSLNRKDRRSIGVVMAKHRRAGFEDHFGPKIVLGPSEMVLKKFEDQNGPQI